MFKVTNISRSRIVINSQNVILSASGTKEDSFLVDLATDSSDKDIASLVRNGILTIEKVGKAKKAPAVVKSKKTGSKDDESQPAITPESSSKKVTYVDGGKVKTGKMVQSIEHNGDIPNPLTVDDQEREKSEKQTDLFI